MGKGADAPDTIGAAQETGEQAIRLNEAQTAANRPNQSNAWGSTQWTNTPVWNPVTGEYNTQWTQTETLNPDMQRAVDAQQGIQAGRSELAEGMMARAWDSYQNPMDFDQYGGPIQPTDVQGVDRFSFDQGMQDFEYDPLNFRQQAEDAAYARATSRLDPQFASQQQALETKLRNQGLSPGDQAYDAAMGNFTRGRNDAYEQARLGATAEGRAEASNLFGQQIQAHQQNIGQQDQAYRQALESSKQQAAQQGQEYAQAQQSNALANQLRQQQIQEDLYKRGFALDEVDRMLQGQIIQGGPPTTGGTTSTESSTYVGNLLGGDQ